MPEIDYRKQDKELYLPNTQPALIDVPAMHFFMLDGKGDPNGAIYGQAVATLYALSYTVKMKGKDLPGYQSYTVFPLEGLWWTDGAVFDFDKRDGWLWTAMIRQPDFVTPEVFARAADLTKRKKPALDLSRVRFEQFAEGLCVQAMHVGPYAAEPQTVSNMLAFMEQHALADATGNVRKHHEIYLSDPRKVHEERLNTVLRHPVERR